MERDSGGARAFVSRRCLLRPPHRENWKTSRDFSPRSDYLNAGEATVTYTSGDKVREDAEKDIRMCKLRSASEGRADAAAAIEEPFSARARSAYMTRSRILVGSYLP